MSAHPGWIDEIARAAARLRSSRHRYPVKVRVHPLDLALLRSRMSGQAKSRRPEAELTRVLGIPVEPDCAVGRGEPVADYE